MKMKSLVIAAALLGGLFSASSFASVALKPALSSMKFEAPVPTRVVQPIALPERHPGSTVTLTMTIDQTGKPHGVKVMSAGDPAPYQRLVAAVSQWQFTPGRRNGVPVSTKVELPLEVVGLNRS